MTPEQAIQEARENAARYRRVRELVKKHGGGFHGPHVEHVSMSEAAFIEMIEDPEFAAIFQRPQQKEPRT